MAAPTLDGNNLGNIESASVIKNANIESLPLPRKDSSNTKLFDFNGATKTVTLSGSYTDTTVSNVKSNFVDVINNILNGYQFSLVDLVTDITGTVSGLVQSFQYEWDINVSEVAVHYTIEFMEGVLGGQ